MSLEEVQAAIWRALPVGLKHEVLDVNGIAQFIAERLEDEGLTLIKEGTRG